MAHVQRRKNGTWLARYRGPDGQEHSKAFDRKIDADNFLTSVEAGKLQGVWADPRLARTRYADWHANWWATTTNLRASSRARDESYARTHVLPRFGHLPLSGIRQLEVRHWVSELQAQGLAAATVQLIYQVLSRSLQAAVDGGLLAASTCRKIPLPRIEKGEMRFLTASEVAALTTCIDEHYRTLVFTAAYTGLRWGELAGLKTTNLNLLQRKLRVSEQLIEVRGALSWGPPKTAAGQRTVSLPASLATMLEEQIASPASIRSGLVFPSPEGEPMRRSNFRRRVWLKAVRRAGLDGLRFHDLRHTAVALAIAQGAHPKAIQERMGHTSITVTLDRYGHLLPTLDEHVAEGLDEAFRNSRANSLQH